MKLQKGDKVVTTIPIWDIVEGSIGEIVAINLSLNKNLVAVLFDQCPIPVNIHKDYIIFYQRGYNFNR
jgi:hypothetical protein